MKTTARYSIRAAATSGSYVAVIVSEPTRAGERPVVRILPETGFDAVGKAGEIGAGIVSRHPRLFEDEVPSPAFLFASEGRWREVRFDSFEPVEAVGKSGRYRVLVIAEERAVPAGEYLAVFAGAARDGDRNGRAGSVRSTDRANSVEKDSQGGHVEH